MIRLIIGICILVFATVAIAAPEIVLWAMKFDNGATVKIIKLPPDNPIIVEELPQINSLDK
jgi:hypothetical protein